MNYEQTNKFNADTPTYTLRATHIERNIRSAAAGGMTLSECEEKISRIVSEGVFEGPFVAVLEDVYGDDSVSLHYKKRGWWTPI